MYPNYNYFDTDEHNKSDSLLDDQHIPKASERDRNATVRLLFKFQLLGKFKIETFFSAVAVLDRYL